MIKILLDADLILEALMNRNEFIENIRELLDQTHPLIQMHLTDVGWQKIHAYASRLQNSKIAEIVFNWLQDKIQICSTDQSILYIARSSQLKDFESAVELVCVSYWQLDAIVTHKPENFVEVLNQYWVWSVADLCVRVNLEIQLQERISS